MKTIASFFRSGASEAAARLAGHWMATRFSGVTQDYIEDDVHGFSTARDEHDHLLNFDHDPAFRNARQPAATEHQLNEAPLSAPRSPPR